MSEEAAGAEGAESTGQPGAEDTTALKNAFERQKADNKALKAKLADLEKLAAQFDGVDIDRVRQLEAEAEKRQESELVDQKKWEELAEKRVAKVAETKDAEITKLAEQLKATQSQLQQILVVDGFKKELATVEGFRNEKGVLDDVERFARDNIRLIDGAPTPMDGDEPQLGSDGKNKTLSQLASEMAKAKPHWFQASTGGGAQNLNGAALGMNKNLEGLSPSERLRRYYEQQGGRPH